MKTFDCSLIKVVPPMEIKAKTEAEAKAIYMQAVQRAITLAHVEAVEVDIVG